MSQTNEPPPGQAAGLGSPSLLGALLGGFDGSDISPKLSPKQIKSYHRRTSQRYAIVHLLQKNGLAADSIPLTGFLVAQVAGIDIIGESANAGDDFAWLQDRDVLVIKDKPSQLGTVPDDPGDTLVVIPLRIAAEIALAAQAVNEKLAHATALNLSLGLMRPERRRNPARRAVL